MVNGADGDTGKPAQPVAEKEPKFDDEVATNPNSADIPAEGKKPKIELAIKENAPLTENGPTGETGDNARSPAVMANDPEAEPVLVNITEDDPVRDKAPNKVHVTKEIAPKMANGHIGINGQLVPRLAEAEPEPDIETASV